jgi:hypothetical protein
MLGRLRLRLIPGARHAWRFWSVRLNALALASGSVLLVAPEILLTAFSVFPEELRAMIPPSLFKGIPLALIAASIVARVIDQEKST